MNLDPAQLAAAVGVSLRHLQTLFREQDRNIADWIWRRRLESAAQRLTDPGFSHLSVGELAYSCGFSTQSHFSRRFKESYGLSPSDYRRRPGSRADGRLLGTGPRGVRPDPSPARGCRRPP